MKTFNERVAALRQWHESLLGRKNIPVEWGSDAPLASLCHAPNGIYEKYKYPILTADHTPLEWRYDFSERDNPHLMQRIMINATLNSGAMKWDGPSPLGTSGQRYVLVVRVEGADRKSFFAVAESPNGIDNFRFWPEPITMPEAPDDTAEGGLNPATNVYDMRLTRHEDGWIYGVFCAERHDDSRPGDLSAATATAGIARTKDLVTWERLPDLKSRSQQRNVVLHPEFVDADGKPITHHPSPTTQILVNESSDLRCLLGVYMTDWQRGNTISTFFSKDSTATYLGDTPQVPRLILGHSYWTNTPVPFMKKIREQLRDTCRKYGIKFWQSELCIMGNDEEIGGGGGYDFTMKTALYVARVMHHDLKYADAESWSWWRACGGDYKDGLIRVYDERERQRMSSQQQGGADVPHARDSKLLWAMGNYSRFVRPSAQRFDVSGPEEDPYGVMCTAYRNSDGRWVAVVINYSAEPQDFRLTASDGRQRRWQAYRTSDAEGENLKPVGENNGQMKLSARSVTTFVEK